MDFDTIRNLLQTNVGEGADFQQVAVSTPPALYIPAGRLVAVCEELYSNKNTYFDFLSCITGIDNGPEEGTMEVVYHLYSIPYDVKIALKVILMRNDDAAPLPEVDSVSHIWRSAEWHEREIYDLVGISFWNHPDLRRILLPTDWVGHPLRKDYQNMEAYHGIKVAY